MKKAIDKISVVGQIIVAFITVISGLVALASLYFAPMSFVIAEDRELYNALIELKDIQCATARAVDLNEKDRSIVDRACEIKNLRRVR